MLWFISAGSCSVCDSFSMSGTDTLHRMEQEGVCSHPLSSNAEVCHDINGTLNFSQLAVSESELGH